MAREGGKPGPKDDISCVTCFNSILFCLGEVMPCNYFAQHMNVDVPPFPTRQLCASCPFEKSAGPSNQFHEYWKNGHFTACSSRFKDLYTCMKIKASSDEDAKVRTSNQAPKAWRVEMHGNPFKVL